MHILEYLRQWRIGDYSVFDSVMTVIALLFLAPWLTKLCARFGVRVPVRNWYFLALPASFLAHVLTGRYTPLTLQVLDPHGHVIAKIVIVVLLVAGIWGIKKMPA